MSAEGLGELRLRLRQQNLANAQWQVIAQYALTIRFVTKMIENGPQ
jgi:hypothetical protein